MKAAGETYYTMMTDNCNHQIYRGEYLQCQNTEDVLEPLFDFLSGWWHGGNAENVGNIWGDMWCSGDYNYSTGECTSISNANYSVSSDAWATSRFWRR